nr:hypothetical protein [Rhodopirellula sp. JC639]
MLETGVGAMAGGVSAAGCEHRTGHRDAEAAVDLAVQTSTDRIMRPGAANRDDRQLPDDRGAKNDIWAMGGAFRAFAGDSKPFRDRLLQAFTGDDHVRTGGQSLQLANDFGLFHRAGLGSGEQLGDFFAAGAKAFDLADSFDATWHRELQKVNWDVNL